MHIRPTAVFAALAGAAALVLTGSVVLARRETQVRLPADRGLLREAAAALQSELARLDHIYIGHLERISSQAVEVPGLEEVLPDCKEVRGISLVAVVGNEKNHRSTSLGVNTLTPMPPKPRLTEEGQSAGMFEFAVPRALVFPKTPPENAPAPGWIPNLSKGWRAWQHGSVDGKRAAILVIRESEVLKAVAEEMTARLPEAWAPIRAAGGLDRLISPHGAAFAGLNSPPDGEPDFVLPLASRLGHWQIESWDRWESRTSYAALPLALGGIIATALLALGFVASSQQRRALAEAGRRVSFVNRVSHELGAPLTNLQLNLDLARDALPDADAAPSEARRRIEIAAEETARLDRLVRNVLSFARADQQELELQPRPCRPAEIIESVLIQFTPALERRHIVVETTLDSSLEIAADPDALSQIISNLVSNVEKYAASGGLLRIALSQRANETVIAVSDRGPGIPASAAEKIFRPFERLDSKLTEGVSGTGLGLSIARDFAQRMGGSLILTNPGSRNGSIFELALPATQSPDETPGASDLKPPAHSAPA